MTKLEGRVAIVTGSGRGIGRAIALKLAADGARVVVNDLDEGPAEDTARAIRGAGSDALVVAGDVTAPDFGHRLVSSTIERFGAIDVLVNNAGYIWNTTIQKHTDEQWASMLDVHATAPFRILRAFAGYLREAAKREGALGMMRMLTPLGRRGRVEDAAGAVYLFCIPESDFITGEVLVCSGGLTI